LNARKVISAFVVALVAAVDWRADVTPVVAAAVVVVVVSGCVEGCSVVAPSAVDGCDDGASDDSEAPTVVCVSTVVGIWDEAVVSWRDVVVSGALVLVAKLVSTVGGEVCDEAPRAVLR
jgi:hypothetical protein